MRTFVPDLTSGAQHGFLWPVQRWCYLLCADRLGIGLCESGACGAWYNKLDGGCCWEAGGLYCATGDQERYTGGKKLRILGITGNIACGKTSVGRMLLSLGAEHYIDADAVVHRLYEPGQPVALGVGSTFGQTVLAQDGSVNRQALGVIVFNDAAAMRQLEAIVHPAVHTAVRAELELVSADGIAILDAVKLLEGGSASLCQSIWLILCSEELQLQRLMQRNQLTSAEAQARLKSQPATRDKLSLVDEVIQNDGTSEETYQQVKTAFERFCVKF